MGGGPVRGGGGLPAQIAGGAAEPIPDLLSRLRDALGAGPDRRGDAGVEGRVLIGAHQQLHPSDAQHSQKKEQDEERKFFLFTRPFKIFHGYPQENLKITLSICLEKDYTTRYRFFELLIFYGGPSRGDGREGALTNAGSTDGKRFKAL